MPKCVKVPLLDLYSKSFLPQKMSYTIIYTTQMSSWALERSFFCKCHVTHVFFRPVEMTASIETALQVVMSFRQGTIDLKNDLEMVGDLPSVKPT